MGNFNNRKIGFENIQTGLISFIADLEKTVHEIHEDIPVYFYNTGDETYLNSRFEVEDDNNEIYKKIPRIVLKFSEIENQIEQATNPNISFKYVWNNKLFESQKTSTYQLMLPITCSMVTSNIISALTYFEMLLTIFNDINVFSYAYMNNNYDGSYNATSYNFEIPPPSASSDAKDIVINFTINLALPITTTKYRYIRELNPINGLPIGRDKDADGNDIDVENYQPINFVINSKLNNSSYKTKIESCENSSED